jgi:hypothetical protein
MRYKAKYMSFNILATRVKPMLDDVFKPPLTEVLVPLTEKFEMLENCQTVQGDINEDGWR